VKGCHSTLNTITMHIINPITHTDWDRQILAAPNYSFFHSSGWAQVLMDTYGYRPVYFGSANGSFACIPVMEVNSPFTGRRGVSLPFTDYCEPLVKDEEQFRVLLNQIKTEGKERGWKYFELRGRPEGITDFTPSLQYFGHILDLTPGGEKLFGRLRSSTRRNIKKASKSGIQISIGNSLEALQEYYLLHCLTRKRLGVPPQPKQFFMKIHIHVVSKNKGIVVLAEYQGRTISGAVYFHLGKKAIYKFGASERSYQHFRANDLIMWEAIRSYSENGFETLCFGRTDMDNEGLRRFKNGWSPKEYLIPYLRFNPSGAMQPRKHNSSNHFAGRLMKYLPISVLRLIGSTLYKHLG